MSRRSDQAMLEVAESQLQQAIKSPYVAPKCHSEHPHGTPLDPDHKAQVNALFKSMADGWDASLVAFWERRADKYRRRLEK